MVVTEVVEGEIEGGDGGNDGSGLWRARSDSTLAASAKRMLLGHVVRYEYW